MTPLLMFLSRMLSGVRKLSGNLTGCRLVTEGTRWFQRFAVTSVPNSFLFTVGHRVVEAVLRADWDCTSEYGGVLTRSRGEHMIHPLNVGPWNVVDRSLERYTFVNPLRRPSFSFRPADSSHYNLALPGLRTLNLRKLQWSLASVVQPILTASGIFTTRHRRAYLRQY
jgi:hypothetical protein